MALLAAPRGEAQAAVALAELEKPPHASILLSHLTEQRANLSLWSGGELTLRVETHTAWK